MSLVLDTTHRRRILFLDLQEVEALEGAEQVVNTATKSPHNPVLALGQIDMSGMPSRRALGPAA